MTGAAPVVEAAGEAVTDRVLTVPNALSLLRLLGVPLFLYLVLGPHEDGWALLVLAVAGLTDYADGKLARAWNQVSSVGALLDPLADRLYIGSTLVALAIRDVIPWWLTGALFARDALLLGLVPMLRARLGTIALPVHFLGKAATFNLLYAFPLLLLGAGHGAPSTVARPVGWAFAIWGSVLYWWAAVLYLDQARRVSRQVGGGRKAAW
ncbi:MAG TPA: CDP-alcohol phosphatidyltransferase family protein [Mycobacteriales bacterium]|nr:CDP-alcohol phosphatidyltransferase family protein [Mycobacteriales bacterium]